MVRAKDRWKRDEEGMNRQAREHELDLSLAMFKDEAEREDNVTEGGVETAKSWLEFSEEGEQKTLQTSCKSKLC